MASAAAWEACLKAVDSLTNKSVADLATPAGRKLLQNGTKHTDRVLDAAVPLPSAVAKELVFQRKVCAFLKDNALHSLCALDGALLARRRIHRNRRLRTSADDIAMQCRCLSGWVHWQSRRLSMILAPFLAAHTCLCWTTCFRASRQR